MYESPISLCLSELQTQVMKQQDEAIYKAIVLSGVDVDKDELIRALAYDRQQYEKGYADAMASFVRCEECRKCRAWKDVITGVMQYACTAQGCYREVDADAFCSYGERMSNQLADGDRHGTTQD